jgi:hypothetical protein
LLRNSLLAMNQRRVPAVYLDPRNLPFLAFLARIGINKLRRINRAYGFESNPFAACSQIGHPPEWVLSGLPVIRPESGALLWNRG